MAQLPALRIHRLYNELADVLSPGTANTVMDLVFKHLDTGTHRVGIMCGEDDCREQLDNRRMCPTHGHDPRLPVRVLIAFDPVA